MPHSRPNVDVEAARALARRAWGIDGAARPLAGERDQNLRLDASDGRRWVLKISNPATDGAVLEMENALLARLAARSETLRFPRLRATAGGADLERFEHHGTELTARLLEWVDGTPLASVRPHDRALLEEVGELLGTVTEAFADFRHAAAERRLIWDLRRAPERIRELLPALPTVRRRLVERAVTRFEAHCGDALGDLPTSVIHNDANDHNVLVRTARDDGWPRPRVAGLIDVGDALTSWKVAELAVGIAYVLLDKNDLLGAARAVVSGYHRVHPLQEPELAVLCGLVRMRLGLSVCNAVAQMAADPDNEYLAISQVGAWKALEALDAIDDGLAECHFRHACGMEPSAGGGALRRWLRKTTGFAPVMELPDGGVCAVDLGVGSTDMGGGAPGSFDATALSARLDARIAAAGASVGVGRYDERRAWYGGDLFAAPSDEAPRRRTLHLGIDIFAPAGARVAAPLDGVVCSAAVNAGRLDYGPTVILEHAPDGGPRFWSLYGHLDPASIEHLQPQQRVGAGDTIAALGEIPDNGGWPPHLHFQLIADRLDTDTDFPGVAVPDERDVWLSLCPDPNLILGLPEALLAPVDLAPETIVERRGRYLLPSLSVAYRRPLTIVRGSGPYLYDRDGQPFLDAVNNVPHVGHAHPRVAAAAAAQEAVLDTNTRYLHPALVRYAERLAESMPEPLSVCTFVCSGSEANELALRMARVHTGRRDVVALAGAYHGNTSTLVDISSYKHAGPGGAGAPDWVHVAAMPDAYRGEHRGPDAGVRFADGVRRCCEEAAGAGGVAAFIAEPLLGCGGQIVPPDGYLAAAFAHVRAAGGVCIADEVQIGFGRVGSHFWAFEAAGATPDIVTLGKPMGNGYPLAAVMTTPEIAASFANGMEYFNTFGGNPVACAVGMAVLDVIEAEQLQMNALRVGETLLAGLRELQPRHALIGDVRGLGLYVGVELVRDHDTLEPAAAEASYVINRLRDHAILTSTDGPLHNVLKIKPPLCFGLDDAARLVSTLDRVLAELD